MWETLTAWFRVLWDSGKQIEKNGDDIKALQEDNEHLTRLVQVLINEQERMREALKHERELRESNLREVRLEQQLRISEELRRLPPASEE